MSTFSYHMTVRTSSKMFKAMLRFFAHALWQCNDIMVKWSLPSPEPSLGDDGLRSPARTCLLLNRDVDFFDLDVRLEGVFVGKDSAPAEMHHATLPRDVITLKVFH